MKQAFLKIKNRLFAGLILASIITCSILRNGPGR